VAVEGLAGRPVGEHFREGLESRRRNAIRRLEVDAQRKAEIGDTIAITRLYRSTISWRF
jgi:hypothetical protein